MTENEKEYLRNLKTETIGKLTAIRDGGLQSFEPILSTDERIRQYVEGVLADPDKHNLYELLGLLKFFRLREKGYKWNRKRVQHYLQKTQKFNYIDESGARTITWSPVQTFQFANIYGWAREDGRRLVRDVVIFIPRKFGKTSMIAGMADYEMIFGPPNGQIYVGANGYTQAKICFDMIRGVAHDIDPNDTVFHVNREKIWFNNGPMHTTATALSDSPKRLDGLNASVVIMDEFSQARNTETKNGAALKNVLTSSMGTRKEPLTVVITTASDVLDGPFYNDLQNILAMLRGEIEDDDTMFASIYMPDVDDDEGIPETWRKCQPHIGTTVLEENYELDYKKALRSADEMLTFRTKQLNIFCVNEQECWVPGSRIMQLQDLEFDMFGGNGFEGRLDCNIGVDLSVKDDFSVVSYIVYDKKNRRFLSQSQYFLPEETLLTHRNKALYQSWAEAGYLTVIPGRVNDPAVIANTIIEKAKLKHLNIKHIGYDPYKSEEMISTLKAWLSGHGMTQKGIQRIIVPVSQSIGNFNKPLETLDLTIGQDRIHFHKEPKLPWCADYAVLMTDNNENKKPVKRVAHKKIDAVITNIQAMGLFYLE